jgi:ATP:ADP antiporter, AAA family
MSEESSSASANSFGRFRSYFWPVHTHEVKKLLPMVAIIFLISFIYSIVRNMKDTIVVTASGAEVIPFIKVWGMLPMAIILTILFTKLSSRYSQERVFYLMISLFLCCFGLFAYVLYPLRDILHPNILADDLELLLPVGFHGLISMVRNWTFTLFYVMSELWGSIALNVLFWGFANEITRVDEARRFYSVFGLGANLAAIIAGQAAIVLSQLPFWSISVFSQKEHWEMVQLVLVTVVILAGLMTMAIFRWLNVNVLNQSNFKSVHEQLIPGKKKEKLSFRESFSHLSNSKYLLCIAVLVISYNLVINLAEVIWKDQLRHLYPDPSDFNIYMNNLTTAIGIVSTLTALCMGKIISRFGWTKTAMITPIVMFITCSGFFSFLFFRENLAEVAVAILGTTPLSIAVFFGAAQNCLSKAAKYSVFDTTKEMTYIPLSQESKLKGKAAIDGVGSRLGKSGGSLIHQGLLMVFSTLSASAPFVAAILIMAIGFWLVAVRSLGKQFSELIATQHPTEPIEPVPAATPKSSSEQPAGVIA